MVSKTLEIFSSVYYVVYMDKKFQEVIQKLKRCIWTRSSKKLQEVVQRLKRCILRDYKKCVDG